MSGALKSLKQVAEFAHPRTLKQLRAAGALDPKSPLALARTLPWLVGRGASLGILSQVNASVIGHKPAIHDRNGTLTFKELDTRANRAAHMLQAEGVSGGDRIALLLRNGREMIEIALGAQKLGVIACPLNTWAKPKELAATLEQADPKLLVYDTAHTEQVEKVAGDDLPLLAVGDPEKAADDSGDYEDLLMRQPTSAPFPFTRNRGAPKVIIHTSGTTGTPKGAARNSTDAGAGALANLLSVVPYHRDDVIVCPAPMFHSFGLATFTFATTLGMTLVLPEKFDPEGSLQLIEKHSASAASFVPVMIKRILALDEDVKSRYDLSSLRIVMASGSAMSPELRRDAMDLFGDVLYDLYGSTEIGWVTIATPDDMKHNPKTVGKPVPGTEIAIFSKDGDRLPPGEVGELYIKSNMLFEGYTSGESRDERDGYTSIGDLGRIDEDGYLFVEGRADDMVVIGGENVYPIEVEELIDGMDGVEESAVLGVTDDEYGEVLAAFVVGSVSEDQVVEKCKSELASYKVPKRVEKLDELPRTSTGKILKRKLIEQLEGAEPLDES
jgi:acyl-CoA synthetase (AMP-forming)/AMP-acid ligase II